MIDDDDDFPPWDAPPERAPAFALNWTFARIDENTWGAGVFLDHKEDGMVDYRPKTGEKIVVTKRSGATRDCVVDCIHEIKEYDSGSARVVVKLR